MRKLGAIALLFFAGLIATTYSLQAAPASASITWTPSTTNTDGSPVTGIDHFDVYIGQSSGNYNLGSIEISDGGATSGNVSVDIPGTYNDGQVIDLFVVMTQTDLEGDESAYSNEVVKQFLVTLTPSVPNPPTVISVEFNLTCIAAVGGVTCTITDISP